MSLIQEALKRQQMEQEGKVPTQPPADIPKATPYAPPPLEETDITEEPPDEAPRTKPSLRIRSESPAITSEDQNEKDSKGQSAAEEPTSNAEPDSVRISPSNYPVNEKTHRIWPALLTTLVVLTLLLGAFIWAVIIGLEWAGIKAPWQPVPVSESTESPAAPQPPVATATGIPESLPPVTDSKTFQVSTEPVSPRETATATVAPGTPAAPPPSMMEGVVQQPESKSSDRPLRESEEKAVASTPPSAAVESTTPVTKPVTAAEITISETMQPPSATRVETPASRMWPDLNISGVVGNNQKGAAFINGKVIGVNESILNVKVLGIRSQSVLLEYEGETRLIKVGQPVNRR